jgi:signal recognition particle subunit SRP54
MQKKLRKNQFDFEDFLKQLNQIKKMGNIKDLMSMIPGVGKAVKDLDIDDDSFKGVEAIIHSMTPYERQNPDALDGSRKKRIALGSGRTPTEINSLIKQFGEMRKMIKKMNNSQGGGRMKMPF